MAKLTGARDINEVLLWASGKAEDRTHTVYAVVNDIHRGKGLLHLSGTDLTRSE
jgi:hypothetical protein